MADGQVEPAQLSACALAGENDTDGAARDSSAEHDGGDADVGFFALLDGGVAEVDRSGGLVLDAAVGDRSRAASLDGGGRIGQGRALEAAERLDEGEAAAGSCLDD